MAGWLPLAELPYASYGYLILFEPREANPHGWCGQYSDKLILKETFPRGQESSILCNHKKTHSPVLMSETF